MKHLSIHLSKDRYPKICSGGIFLHNLSGAYNQYQLFIITAFTLCSLIFCTAGEVQAERTIILSRDRGSYEVGPYLEILEDKNKEWSVDDVSSEHLSSQFVPVTSRILNLGMTSSAYWIRFTVTEKVSGNVSKSSQVTWLLESVRPLIQSLKLFIPASDKEIKEGAERWIVKEAGEPVTLTTGQPPRKLLVFRLPADLATPRTFYIRIEDFTSIFLPLRICTDEAYLNMSKHRMLWQGLYFGIILALASYNLFLFISLRDRSYLWYVLYVSFLSIFFMGINGLTYEYILHGPPSLNIRTDLFFLGAALLGLGQFTRSFLMTGRCAPLTDKLLVIFMFMAGLLALLCPLVRISTVNHLCSHFGLITPFIIIGSGVVCWLRGFRPARYFLLALAVLAVSGLIYDLTIKGLLPFTSLTFHGFQAGSALEAILLSFALGDRIKTMKREREESRKNERRLIELAMTDYLTGLYNSRYFKTQISFEIQRTESFGVPLSLVFLDVDNFKKYNDTYGHIEGDKVLAILGEIILSSIRDSDLACRYGGEEFALILPGSRGQKAVEVTERIRSAFETHFRVPHVRGISRVTVSIGVAEYIFGEDITTFIDRADKAMYLAKAQGKNQIVFAS